MSGTCRPPQLQALAFDEDLASPVEPRFDDVVRLASRLCAASVASVSLVDHRRQWIEADGDPSSHIAGLNAAVRALVPTEHDLLQIPDLAADPRTAADARAMGAHPLRFYASIALRSREGEVIGRLSVADGAPRPKGLSPAQEEDLRGLARQTADQLELRRALVARDRLLGRQRAPVDEVDAPDRIAAASPGPIEAGEVAIHRAVRADEAQTRSIVERYRLVGRATNDAVWDWDLATDHLLWNEALEKAYGHPPASVRPTGDWRMAHIHPDDRARVEGSLRDVVDGGDASWTDDYRFLRAGGGYADVLDRGYVIRDAGGRPIRMIGAMLDLTARKRAEAELREGTRQLGLERSLLQAVLQQAPVGISIAGATPLVPTMINARAEQMLGHGVGVDGPGEARYENYGALHLDGRRYLAAEYPTVRALRTGEVVRDEEMGYRNARTGEVRRIEVSSAPVRDADGATQAAVTILTDVEVARRAQEAIEEAQRFTGALLELGDRLRDLSLIPDAARSAAEVAGSALGASRVCFRTLAAAGERVTVEADWTAPGRTIIAGHPFFGLHDDQRAAVAGGRPFIISDVRTDPRTAANSAALSTIGVQAIVGMPVRERGRTTTLLFVCDDVPRAWTEAELAFVRAIVDRVEAGVARLRAEDRQRLLGHELSHRIKNLLAMVQSIAVQTMRNATSVGDARDVLSARFVALGKAHDLLLGGSLSSSRLDAVVRDALEVHQDHPERFAISGPDIEIGAEPALTLSLSLHELATNAAKHGALATERGRVTIGWRLVEHGAEPSLRLVWAESGGPPVQPPVRKGFGSRFLERALATQVGGEMALTYPETGVTFALTAPLSAILKRPEGLASG